MRRARRSKRAQWEYRGALVVLTDRSARCECGNSSVQIWSAAANGLVCAACYRAAIPSGPYEGPSREPPKHLSHP